MKDFTVRIEERIALLTGEEKRWRKELNLIGWNGKEPKYDIRNWSADHKVIGKGIALTFTELNDVSAALEALVETQTFEPEQEIISNTSPRCSIVKTGTTITKDSKDWTLEVNVVSWNEQEPTYDIRTWGPKRETIGKGITLNRNEAIRLIKATNELKKEKHLVRKLTQNGANSEIEVSGIDDLFI